jgi:hypothetical protein
VKNGDQQFWTEKFHPANEKAQHALMNKPVFFFLKVGWGGVGGTGIFCFFPLVPNVFPKSFHKVSLVPIKFPNVFPKMFPTAPGFYPIWFAQSSTPLYLK